MVVLQESVFGWRVNIVMIGCLYKKPKFMIRNSIQELKSCDQGHGIKETTISSTHRTHNCSNSCFVALRGPHAVGQLVQGQFVPLFAAIERLGVKGESDFNLT